MDSPALTVTSSPISLAMKQPFFSNTLPQTGGGKYSTRMAAAVDVLYLYIANHQTKARKEYAAQLIPVGSFLNGPPVRRSDSLATMIR